MSRVAKRFWNHKRIAREEARRNLEKMGVLVNGPELPTAQTMAEATRPLARAYVKAIYSYKSPLLEALKKK